MTEQRILIVDDNQNNLVAMLAILEDLGIQCDTALGGNEALFKMMEHKYALLLLDVQMPEMDGFELAAIIKQSDETRHIPIIFVTAINKDACHVIKGYDNGAIDYMFKPINAEILQSKVTVLLELDSRNRELEEAYTNAYEQYVQLQLIMSSAGEGIIGLDNSGQLTYINSKAEHLLKIDEKAVANYHMSQLLAPDTWSGSSIEEICKKSGYAKDIETCFQDTNKNSVPVSYSMNSVEEITGQHCGSVLVFRDLTRQKEVENKLMRLSNYDSLTGLSNRTLFHEYLTSSIRQSSKSASFTVLLLIDIDNFRQVNENLGNQRGDKVLVMLSERLEQVARGNELLSRLGGNEFGVILPMLSSVDEIIERAQAIKDTLSQKITMSGRDLFLACSIGIATSDDTDNNFEDLISAAGLALQQAKEAGKNTIQFYSQQLHQQNALHFDIKMRLTELVKNDDFQLFYQPKVNATDGRITGAEGLIRWPANDSINVGPHIFIPIAEKSGQIQEIGDWVLRTGVAQLSAWQKQGWLTNEFKLSLNLSTIQLLDSRLADNIALLLKEHHLDSRYLELEITESAVMYEPTTAIKNLNLLHEQGISIAIDDFGTGYSSLSYLTNLPINVLKIDKSFVDKIGTLHNEEMVVQSIIGLSNSLHLKTVAEGVETSEQCQFLLKNGCETIQGYLFSKPLPLKEFTDLLSAKKPLLIPAATLANATDSLPA